MSQANASRGPRQPRRPRSRLRLAAIYAAVAIALLGSGGLVAAHLENDDSFCASCHTQPESTFFQRSRAAAAVDLSSAHALKGVGCIECHSGVGVSGRISAMRLGADDLTAYLAGHYNNPAKLTVPIADANCLKCHADISDKNSFDNHFHVLLPKWQRLDPAHAATCAECHASHATGGQQRIAFLQPAPTQAICQRCHEFAGEGLSPHPALLKGAGT